MRVIVPEPNDRYDFTKAMNYGKIVYLMDQAQNPFRDALMEEYLRLLSEIEFDAEQDIVCMTGQNLVIAQLLAAVFQKYRSVRVLMFDARVADYRLKVFKEVASVETA